MELIEKYSVSASLAFFFIVVAYIVLKRTRILIILYHIISYAYRAYETDNPINVNVIYHIVGNFTSSNYILQMLHSIGNIEAPFISKNMHDIPDANK